MLEPDTVISENDEDDYVSAIQEWCEEETGELPFFRFEEKKGQLVTQVSYTNFDTNEYIKRLQSKYQCHLIISDGTPPFHGFGNSKSEARRDACKVAYEWLEETGGLHTIRDELEDPNRDDAIGQLETLARRGYFSLPTYEFEQAYDRNGNPIWTAKCCIEEAEYYFESSSSSKKDAKKDAAFEMLKHVLEEF